MHNPLYNFCEKLSQHVRRPTYSWTDETYSEMVGRLCYLIDNGQSLHRTIFGEPIKQEIHYYECMGTRVPIAGSVITTDPIWGEAEFIPLHHDSYLINIRLSGGDGCWSFAGKRRQNITYSEPLLIRTPYVTDAAEDIDIAIKFFEPKPLEDVEHHDECISHFFSTYAGNEIEFDVMEEFRMLEKQYGHKL